MIETKTYKFHSGEYTEFRPTEFFDNHIDGSFKFEPCGDQGTNWLEDSEWISCVKDIVKISNEIIIVVWNSVYNHSNETTLYKGTLK